MDFDAKQLLPCGDGVRKSKRITKLTVESERTFIFRTRSSTQAAWCAGCGAEVEMVTIDVAAREAGLRELAVYQLIASGALHSTEDAEGRLLVCLNSLPDWARRRE